ncbi:protection of telomeres protein 1b [Silene latifolia]|uniref:protection of telomeres protein 1b n=1 Tax=Silene latifolia TaxID=37657 RepID=UPI003D76DAC7
MGKFMRDDYRFMKLADANCALNQKVNLIGIIVEHSTPCRSRGTDWFLSLRIVDESYHDSGLVVNIFAENEEKLPQIDASGDIIQVSHVVMKSHNAESYAQYNKRFSSYALYEGKYGESCRPYQFSCNFRQRDQDMTFVVGLRKWVVGVQLSTVTKDSVLLRQLQEGHCCDLVCKIFHVSGVSEDEWMLFIWDGSDAPPLHIPSKLDDEIENPLRLQVEPQSLPKDILCKFPSVGTTLRVSVQRRNVNFHISSLITGRWVKFINMTLNVTQGLWCGVLTRETKVRFVPSDDIYILERERDFVERFASNLNRMPFASFPWPARVTEVDRKAEHVPLATLMDILTYSQVTAKFKCIVRVVACVPNKVEDFRSPTGVYRIRVTLEDPTARIHAYLYADDAEVFFDGYPRTGVLTRKWKLLLGITDVPSEAAPRNPPWMVCCIKSYSLDDSNAWESRRFRIFNTKLVI